MKTIIIPLFTFVLIFQSISLVQSTKEDVLPLTLQVCYANLHLGDNCTDNGQRYDLSCDLFGYCKNGKCVATLKIGDKCDVKLTKCDPGSYCNNATSRCTPYRSVNLGGSCKVDNDCIGNNTACLNSICMIDSGGCIDHIDCEYNKYCKKSLNSTYGICTLKHSSGTCTSTAECSYPKICGIKNGTKENECVYRNSKSEFKPCLDPNNYECEEGLYCSLQSHSCLINRQGNRPCNSSCDCSVDELCGYDIDQEILVCKNFTQRYFTKSCNQYQSYLLDCAYEHKCPIESLPVISLNNKCLFEHCKNQYKSYIYVCDSYQQPIKSSEDIPTTAIDDDNSSSSAMVLFNRLSLIFLILLSVFLLLQ